jgi:hypothetical protein
MTQLKNNNEFKSDLEDILSTAMLSESNETNVSVFGMAHTLIEEGRGQELYDVLKLHFPEYYMDYLALDQKPDTGGSPDISDNLPF